MKTAIVILNWNTQKYLEQFLPILKQYSSLEETEIFVADNASSDDSVAFVRNTFPDIRLIVFDRNYGFADGYNRALQQIDAEYFVILNSDIEVTENWLAPLVRLLDENQNIAACMPKIKSFYDRTSFEYAGAAGGYIDKFGYPFCKGRIFDTVEKDTGQYDGIYPVFWATGACLVIRSSRFHEVGGFDPYFFAHMEEIDLCWRLNHLGYHIFCTTQATVYHMGGGTLPKSNPRKTYLNFRNNLILLYKNLSGWSAFYMLLMRMILDGVAACKMLAEGKLKEVSAVFKAHRSFYVYFWNSQKKKTAVRSSDLMIYPKSIVFQYYIRKRKYYSRLS